MSDGAALETSSEACFPYTVRKLLGHECIPAADHDTFWQAVDAHQKLGTRTQVMFRCTDGRKRSPRQKSVWEECCLGAANRSNFHQAVLN